MQNQKWPYSESLKKCEFCYAHIQNSSHESVPGTVEGKQSKSGRSGTRRKKNWSSQKGVAEEAKEPEPLREG